MAHLLGALVGSIRAGVEGAAHLAGLAEERIAALGPKGRGRRRRGGRGGGGGVLDRGARLASHALQLKVPVEVDTAAEGLVRGADHIAALVGVFGLRARADAAAGEGDGDDGGLDDGGVHVD